ncbi:MAG: response regulator [Fuscovulum sp.]|jgi:two-component system phosphate regulon response regulator PhoB|nr:response regulator [Fuscovulum sp.]
MTAAERQRLVLVVEDEDNIATALEFVILREGLRYERVASGAEALATIRAHRPDLVLLDVMLPEVSGFDICGAVRTDPALHSVRIVMMTARGSALQRNRCLELGADGFVAKPFDLQTLRSEIRSQLARAS